MSSKLFIDSDVVIDFFINRKPYVEKATKIFDLNERNKITLFISALSINNIYYITRKYLGHSSTIEVVEELIDMFEIVGTNKQDIVQALNNNFSDFEDSIQYSTALKVNDLDAIITRNLKDYKNSKITVLTPKMFLNKFYSS